MMVPTDLIGSRPMPLDYEPRQRRTQRRAEAAAAFLVAFVGGCALLAPLVWHVASAWGR